MPTPRLESFPLRSSRRLVWLLLAALLLGIALFVFLRTTAPVNNAPNPWKGSVPVKVETARLEDFGVQLQAIGTVAPYNAVTVRSRVEGELLRVLVREGQKVERGQLLAEMDPAPFRVRLAQVEGQQQQNRAQLKNAESELARHEQLFAQDAVARQQLERQAAMVQQLRGTIQSDQAQVDHARLQLSYTRIVAPISGRVGLRRVDAGNLVSANDANGLFSLLQTQPVSVLFHVPEPQVARVRAAYGGAGKLVVQAWDRHASTLLAQGELETLDNQIDVATGTLRMKARFANADDNLFPNQFVNVRLMLQTLQGVVTIAQDAVQYGSNGSYVYVIKDKKATVRMLELGSSGNGRVVVEKGLEKGEAVVLEGLDRLREGRAVTVIKDAPPVATVAPVAAASQTSDKMQKTVLTAESVCA